MSKVLRMLLQSAILAVGAWLVINQQSTPGIIIAGSILGGRALAPVDLAIANWRGFVAARQSWERLSRLLAHLAGAECADGVAAAERARWWCRARRSRCRADRPVVCQDVNFTLTAGKALGVIGPTASGKSSLARMLVGVWTPVRGSVRLDGASIDQWSPEALGRHIGYLPQDVELFPGNVAQNIARFEDPPDAEAVLAAAQAAGVHDLIVNLPQGYETSVGDHGKALSAGQAQRVALARALYRDPFLVVLDEPNSNLDAEGDEALTRAILGIRARGAIAVVVAHRPSAIAGVDYILVMAKGRQQQFGPKEEILNRVIAADATAAGFEGGAGKGWAGMIDKLRNLKLSDLKIGRLRLGSPSSSSEASIRKHIVIGSVLVAVLALGLGGWASTAEISGALIAQGTIVVDSNIKKVQHPTGGVVGEVRVHDGDRVKAGDILIRLDETVTRANLAIVTKGLNELYARKARLGAERDGADTMAVPRELADSIDNPDVKDAMDSERKLFELRRDARLGQKNQLQERIKQLQEQITGLVAQQDAKAKELGFIDQELAGVRDLWQKNLVQLNRLTSLERDEAKIQGERGAADRQCRGSQGQDGRNPAANPSDRPAIRQRRRQGIARDRRQDRRSRRAQGDGGRSAPPHRHPRATGRHRVPDDGEYGRRRHRSRRPDHADRAGLRHAVGRGQGRAQGRRSGGVRPAGGLALLGLQPAHHAGA